jgi:hypothetical protein
LARNLDTEALENADASSTMTLTRSFPCEGLYGSYQGDIGLCTFPKPASAFDFPSKLGRFVVCYSSEKATGL